MEHKTSEAHRRASAKFDAEHARKYCLKLYDGTDADIIAHLDKQPNKQGYIKRLIREDIAREKEENP